MLTIDPHSGAASPADCRPKATQERTMIYKQKNRRTKASVECQRLPFRSSHEKFFKKAKVEVTIFTSQAPADISGCDRKTNLMILLEMYLADRCLQEPGRTNIKDDVSNEKKISNFLNIVYL